MALIESSSLSTNSSFTFIIKTLDINIKKTFYATQVANLNDSNSVTFLETNEPFNLNEFTSFINKFNSDESTKFVFSSVDGTENFNYIVTRDVNGNVSSRTFEIELCMYSSNLQVSVNITDTNKMNFSGVFVDFENFVKEFLKK